MKKWLLSPNALLAGFIVLGSLGLYAAYRQHVNERAEAKVGAIAAATTKKAQDTITKVAEGEAEAPKIPEDKKALIELCNRSASCRSRQR